MNKLEAQHLYKSYKSRAVVNGISLQVAQSQIIGLLGPNGAGKTTCFYMLVGLIQPDAGEVILNGQSITHCSLHQRAQLGLGYLPQEPSIFRQLSVADNILAILQLRKDLKRKQQREQLDQLLEEFHITHLRDTLGIRLSGGERRRVEIARAIAINPKFLLLDEPFAGIDPISVVDLKQLIYQLAEKGIGILITDHNVRETLSLCEKAYIVHQGQVIAAGNAQELLQNQQVRAVYLGEEFVL